MVQTIAFEKGKQLWLKSWSLDKEIFMFILWHEVTCHQFYPPISCSLCFNILLFLSFLSDDLSQVLTNVRAYFHLVVLLVAMDNEMQVLLLNVYCDDIGMTISVKTF